MYNLKILYRYAASGSYLSLITRIQRILLVLRKSKIRHASSGVRSMGITRICILVEMIEVVQEI